MKILFWAWSFAFPGFALANGGGYMSGTLNQGALGAFQPKNAEKIEMVTEDLRIDLHDAYGHVEVEYTLHNPGSGTTAEVGFPCKALTKMQELGEAEPKWKEGDITPPFRNFSVELDGKKLVWKMVRDPVEPVKENNVLIGTYRHVPLWYTFKIPMKREATARLRVSYDTSYFHSAFGISGDDRVEPETLSYLFSTAAVWKGPIREGKVLIRALGVPAEQVKLNQAKRFQRKGDIWTWEFKDFEPGLGDDLRIVAHPARLTYRRSLPGSGEDGPRVQFVNIEKRWEMHHHEYSVEASSTLAPTRGAGGRRTYDASNLKKDGPSTAWAEGVEGDGVGESLTLTLRPPRKVSQITVLNGYYDYRNAALSEQNGRVAEFAVSINGRRPYAAVLPQEYGAHTNLIPVPAGAGAVETIKLTIRKVHPGTEFHDTCLSDITLVTPLAKKPYISPIR
jgi:hypothetical protein